MINLNNKTYFNTSIDEWINTLNINLTKTYKMNALSIETGDFSYTAYGNVICAILDIVTNDDIKNYMNNSLDNNKFINAAHSAWCNNYINAKNLVPTKVGRDPAKKIHTHCRNERATTFAIHLNKDDVELYTNVIKELFDIIVKKLLVQTMNNLSISS